MHRCFALLMLLLTISLCTGSSLDKDQKHPNLEILEEIANGNDENASHSTGEYEDLAAEKEEEKEGTVSLLNHEEDFEKTARVRRQAAATINPVDRSSKDGTSNNTNTTSREQRRRAEDLWYGMFFGGLVLCSVGLIGSVWTAGLIIMKEKQLPLERETTAQSAVDTTVSESASLTNVVKSV